MKAADGKAIALLIDQTGHLSETDHRLDKPTLGCHLTAGRLVGREAVLPPVSDGPLAVPAFEAEILVPDSPAPDLHQEGSHLVEKSGNGLLRGHGAPGHHTATQLYDRLDSRELVVLP